MESKTKHRKYLPARVSKAELMQELGLDPGSKLDKAAYKCIQNCAFETLVSNSEQNLVDMLEPLKSNWGGWVAAEAGGAKEGQFRIIQSRLNSPKGFTILNVFDSQFRKEQKRLQKGIKTSSAEIPVGAELDEDLDENLDEDPGEGRSQHPGEVQPRLPYDPIRDVPSNN